MDELEFRKMLYKEYYDKLLEYMGMYGSYYTAKEREMILHDFLYYDQVVGESNDVLNQVFELTGISELEPDNTYNYFLKEMKKRYDINQRLLDVGCGYYPAFAEKLSKIQKYGSIDAIDPNVVTTDISGVNVRKEKFNSTYDISRYDLIYGIQPCTASFDMIKAANLYDKDLFFLVCNCGATYRGKVSMQMWLKLAEQIMIQSIPSHREYKIERVRAFKQPLIYTKRRK